VKLKGREAHKWGKSTLLREKEAGDKARILKNGKMGKENGKIKRRKQVRRFNTWWAEI